MREVARIDRIINKLRRLWYYTPDWRFFQMLNNYFGDGDNFYVEDTTFETFLDKIMNDYKNNQK